MSDYPPNCVAFITGAASGIGLAVAHRLLHDGVLSLVLVDLTTTHLNTALSSLTALNPAAKLLPLGADCSKVDDVEAAVESAVKEFGRLDVCFNAAGIAGIGGSIVQQTNEGLDSVIGVNLLGVWYCERAQIRQLLKQEERKVVTGLDLRTRGSIVNVGSILSKLAIPALTPYIMAKHGILGLTKGDAVDFAKEGIRVNCICPGWINTAMTQRVRDDPEKLSKGLSKLADVKKFEQLIMKAPMARWGLPEEVAYLAAFLLSDKASFITGTSVDIDGGYTCV